VSRGPGRALRDRGDASHTGMLLMQASGTARHGACKAVRYAAGAAPPDTWREMGSSRSIGAPGESFASRPW
jgi:hypothetical protein